MTFKTLLEALLIGWVKRSMYRGERKSQSGQRIRGKVWREPTDGRWKWTVEMWSKQYWNGMSVPVEGWDWGAHGDALTRLGAHARVRIALRAYEHGSELVR